MGISAGRLSGYIRIITDLETPDGVGGFTLSPSIHWEGPAHIERLQSFRGDVERMTAGAVGSHPIVRIHVRYDDLTAELIRTGSKMRIEDEETGVTMSINFAQDMTGRREMVVITATENLPG